MAYATTSAGAPVTAGPAQFGQPLPQWLEVRFPSPRTIEQFCIVTFQTQLGTENAAKWGVKDYVIEVWDGEGEQWNVVVEENRGRTMKNRVHKLAAPVRTERFRVVIHSRGAPRWHRASHAGRSMGPGGAVSLRERECEQYICTHGLGGPACATVHATLL